MTASGLSGKQGTEVSGDSRGHEAVQRHVSGPGYGGPLALPTSLAHGAWGVWGPLGWRASL